MSASLVGSEMCIRDSFPSGHGSARRSGFRRAAVRVLALPGPPRRRLHACLLYTSDAADDM
eukprot:5779690-Alexandrium_andersonii.AAC.1